MPKLVIDVSDYNAAYNTLTRKYKSNIDWALLASHGVVGAIVKSSQGNYNVQGSMPIHAAGAVGVGMFVDLYHWADPLIYWREQIELIVRSIDTLAKSGINVRRVWIDTEQQWADWQEWARKKITKIIEPARIADCTYNILQELDRRLIEDGIYTRLSFIKDYAPGVAAYLPEYANWLASYPRNGIKTTWEMFLNTCVPTVQPPQGTGCKPPELWQFTGDQYQLAGISGGVDLSIYYPTAPAQVPDNTADLTLEQKVNILWQEHLAVK